MSRCPTTTTWGTPFWDISPIWGPGALTSNVKQDKDPRHRAGGVPPLETGLKKFGAMLGDHVEVGCNSVFKPWYRGGEKLPGVPALHGAGLCAQRYDPQKQRRNGAPAGGPLRAFDPPSGKGMRKSGNCDGNPGGGDPVRGAAHGAAACAGPWCLCLPCMMVWRVLHLL